MAGGHISAARRHRRLTIGLVAAAVVAVAVHLGLGTMLVASPWAGWAAGAVVVMVVVKLVGMGFVARFVTRHRRRQPSSEAVVRATASVPTPKAERYAKQLCGHAAWKARHAAWTPPNGVIEFPDDMGTCRVTAEPDRLLLTVDATSPANLARVQEIIGGNIERFAQRDGLTVRWAPD